MLTNEKMRYQYHLMIAKLLLPCNINNNEIACESQPFFTQNEMFKNPVIAFTGTNTVKDLFFDDLNIRPISWPNFESDAKVHGGFAIRTNRLLEDLHNFIEDSDNFVLGGHSLGGACAILSASYLVSIGKKVDNVYTFGVPCVGSKKFQDYYKKQGLWERTFNYVTTKDPIVNRIPRLYKPIGQYIDVPCDYESSLKQHDIDTYYDLLSVDIS